MSPIVHAQQGDDIGYIEGAGFTIGAGFVYTSGREKVFDLADFEYAEFSYFGGGVSTDQVSTGPYMGFVTGWSQLDNSSVEQYAGPSAAGNAGVSIPGPFKVSPGTSWTGFVSLTGPLKGLTQSLNIGVSPLNLTPFSATGTVTNYSLDSVVVEFRSDPNLPPSRDDALRFQQFAREKILNPVLESVVVDEIDRVQREWK